MPLVGFVVAVAIWIWAQYLPGYVVGRFLVPDARGLARHTVALVAGFSLVPLATFLLSVGGGLPMDGRLVLTVASAINLVGGLLLLAPRWRRPLDIDTRSTVALAAATAAIAVWLLVTLRAHDMGDALGTAQHCIYVITIQAIANDPSVSIPFHDAVSGSPFHFLVHHTTDNFNGLAPLVYRQRLGNIPLLAGPVSLFGTLGWFVSALHAAVITALSSWLAMRAVGVRAAVATVATAVFVHAVYAFSGYVGNENMFATALLSFLVWGSLRREASLGWIALLGLVAGHLVGVRYTSALFWPAVALAVLWRPTPWRARLGRLALGVGCAAITVAPWLWVNAVILGAPFSLPSAADGGLRVVTNRLFGAPFTFKALNWPFTDTLVRTPWNPFPTFLWLPLEVVRCFGQLAVAVAAVGAAVAARTAGRPRRAVVLLLAFAVPHFLAMAWLEGVDAAQLTYAAPGLVPLGIFLALGLDALVDRGRRVVRAVAVAAVLVTLVLGARAIRPLEFPADPRLLEPADWPTPPGLDRGARAVAQELTGFAPLPVAPWLRGDNLARLSGALASVATPTDVPTMGGLPVYPSGRVVLQSAGSAAEARGFRFVLAGSAPRSAETPVRTAGWMHIVSLAFPAERLVVDVARDDTRFFLDVTPVGRTAEARDFTFYLNPWSQTIHDVQVTREGAPLADLRLLPFGAAGDESERLLIATNHPPAVLDVVAVPFTIDTNGEPAHCGFFSYTLLEEAWRLETTPPMGGHDHRWHGRTEGVLTVPRNLLADRVLLVADPYCGELIPQRGGRFALHEGGFAADRPIHFRIDGMW